METSFYWVLFLGPHTACLGLTPAGCGFLGSQQLNLGLATRKANILTAILFLWLLTHNFVTLSFKNHLISKSQSDSIAGRALFSGITPGGGGGQGGDHAYTQTVV